jgi:endogenous inhibitor of DNA gyrase (YacG/DUF329 family)
MKKTLSDKIEELKNKERNKPCAVCGKPVNGRTVLKKFCSNKCRQRAFQMGLNRILKEAEEIITENYKGVTTEPPNQ